MNNIELQAKIKTEAGTLIYERGYVCAIDVLKKLSYLSDKDYEDWRFVRVSCLENVCRLNLSKLSLINKTIRKFAFSLKLEQSITVYNKFGKIPNQKLFFSKSRQKNIEDAYATHYLDKKRIGELKIQKANNQTLIA